MQTEGSLWRAKEAFWRVQNQKIKPRRRPLASLQQVRSSEPVTYSSGASKRHRPSVRSAATGFPGANGGHTGGWL